MHALLEGDTRFLCRATLRARLWDLGAYPALTDARSRRDVVHGELYAIDASRRDALLASLDRYEGAAFERAVREVEGEDGTRHAAFVYLFLGDLRGGRRIASGDYVAELRGGR